MKKSKQSSSDLNDKSAIRRLKGLAAAAAIAGGVIIPPAAADLVPRNPLEERVASVRIALSKEQSQASDPALVNDQDSAIPVQWLNWGNWGNWNNWVKWDDWNNWHDWHNWNNFDNWGKY